MIVIADDITGAAEMAGIAYEHGLPVSLCCCPVCCDIVAANGTTVIATDTRSMTEAEAVAETKRIAKITQRGRFRCVIFKKTDSALRGHVVAELKTLMEILGYHRAVYLPANPSKGRIIRDGTYFMKEVRGEGLEVREVPIHETAFSYDPEFPAKTSVLKERFPDAEACGILMPDAESKEDIQRIIADYDDGQTLFAGAADLFEALVSGYSRESRDSRKSGNPTSSTLFLCGSTQSKPLEIGIPITEMPLDIYDGSKDIEAWMAEADAVYEKEGSLMITIPYRHRTGKDVAVHLREMTALLIQQLVSRRQPQQLIIEGGASAFATLQRLGWNELEVVCQIAPGVIKTKAPNGTFVIMKPGSYPWGSLF